MRKAFSYLFSVLSFAAAYYVHNLVWAETHSNVLSIGAFLLTFLIAMPTALYLVAGGRWNVDGSRND